MDGETLQMVVQAGAVGISIVLIGYSAWKDKIYNKTLNNHLAHTYDSDRALSKALGDLSIVIDRVNETSKKLVDNHENIKSVLNNNTETLRDVYKVLK